MSGLEVVGAISAVLGIVDGIVKVWNTAQKDIKFNKTIDVAISRLFVLQSILKTCEENLKKVKSLSSDDDKRLATVMRTCEANIKKLDTIFQETISGGKDKWHEKYKRAYKRFGTGSRVEELVLRIVEDAKIVATYNEVLSLSPDLGDKLDEITKELQSLQPSVSDDSTDTYTFTNTGSGRQSINTGDGTQMNDNARIFNHGDGNPVFNFGKD
jgi:predicted choloylglycine hydrolase